MIGPHEGKELELMLAGQKPLAMFYDVLNGQEDISNDIIPEKEFAPHVKSNLFIRVSRDLQHVAKQATIRYVLFCKPEEVWRAHFIFWLKEQCFASNMQHNPAHDEIIGRLLGYHVQDIDDFFDRG